MKALHAQHALHAMDAEPADAPAGLAGTAAERPCHPAAGAAGPGLHIAFLAPRIWPVLSRDAQARFVGGAEVQQSVQMRGLQAAGCRISVLTQDHGQPATADCDGITVHRVPAQGRRGLPGLRFFHPRMSDVVRLLDRVNPDLVFVQTASEEAAFAAAWARLRRRPFVFAGASDMDFITGALPGMPAQHAAAYRMALRAADAVIVQNAQQQALLAQHFGRRGQLIGNGLDEPNARPAAFDGPVLWAATFKALKRPALFIELARRLPAHRFLMVGGPAPTDDGPSAFAAAQQQAAALPNLTLTGHVPFDAVGRHFDGAAAFVNTSEYEGLPNTFVQAWLRGVPTLSFVRPESAPGECGTIACDELNGAQGMAARLARLLQDGDAWRQASRDCHAHFMRHHTLQAVVQAHLALFRAVLARHAGARPAVAATPRAGATP